MQKGTKLLSLDTSVLQQLKTEVNASKLVEELLVNHYSGRYRALEKATDATKRKYAELVTVVENNTKAFERYAEEMFEFRELTRNMQDNRHN